MQGMVSPVVGQRADPSLLLFPVLHSGYRPESPDLESPKHLFQMFMHQDRSISIYVAFENRDFLGECFFSFELFCSKEAQAQVPYEIFTRG